MKILAIDDQQLILMSIKKRLTEIGYEVETANSTEEGIILYNSFSPDLVLLDMNMPEMSGNELVECTGTEVVKYIRFFMKKDTPILVLSGNTDESVILENFNLGINDYLKKPVSLNQMAERVNRILGATQINNLKYQTNTEIQIIKKNSVGIVIPCHNEEENLKRLDFKAFANKNLGYHLCFVNYGSTDNTLDVLRELRDSSDNNISVCNWTKKGGKAEAIRQGIQHLIKNHQFDYVGFLNSDLSTDFRDFDDLVLTIENTEYKIVSGCSTPRKGIDVAKKSVRKLINKTTNLIVQTILGMPFKNTQGGAKVMNREIASQVFKTKFRTRWLFDIEIFMRMKRRYGKKEAIKVIFKQPVNRILRPS